MLRATSAGEVRPQPEAYFRDAVDKLAEVKAIACELPATHGPPLGRVSFDT